MDNTFVPNIRADVWYNGGPPVGLRGYLNDYVSRVMGYATIRQLRVRRGTSAWARNLLDPDLGTFVACGRNTAYKT